MVEERKQTRPPVKRQLIVATLIRQIKEGVYAPGSRLPTRIELSERFRTGPITLSAAIRRLTAHGFATTRQREGSYVAQRLPHLHRYGVVFRETPGSHEWPLYWTAIANEAKAIGQDGVREIVLYESVNTGTPPSRPDKRRLGADLHAGCLAGLIVVGPPALVLGKATGHIQPLPRVAITSAAEAAGWPYANADPSPVLLDKVLDSLAARGRRRIAILMHDPKEEREGEILACLAKRGMTTEPQWIIPLPLHETTLIERVTRLLFAPDRRARPDGLFIWDDNLVEPATRGLLAAGVRAGQDVDVVAHANFPLITPSHVPARRIGYDIRELLVACFDLLDRQRDRRAGPPGVLIPARFENEVRVKAMNGKKVRAARKTHTEA